MKNNINIPNSFKKFIENKRKYNIEKQTIFDFSKLDEEMKNWIIYNTLCRIKADELNKEYITIFEIAEMTIKERKNKINSLKEEILIFDENINPICSFNKEIERKS